MINAQPPTSADKLSHCSNFGRFFRNQLKFTMGKIYYILEHSESGEAVHGSQLYSNFRLFNKAFIIRPGS